MLDQNTDRMWFVIGAVIVGAAIIFIANGSLPTLFASVGESMEGTADQFGEVVEEMDTVHSFDAGDMTLSIRGIQNAEISNIQGEGLDTSFDLLMNEHAHSGLHIKPTYDKEGLNGWNPSKKYKVSYTMTVYDDSLTRLSHDVRGKGIRAEGHKSVLNGVQHVLEGRMNSITYGPVLKVELHMQPSEEVKPYVDRIAVYPNDELADGTVVPVKVRISDVRVSAY